MENYVQTAADIIRDRTLSVNARVIYSILATYCTEKDRTCTPTLSELLQCSGMGKNTFYRYMKELEQRGIVKKEYVRTGPDRLTASSSIAYAIKEYPRKGICLWHRKKGMARLIL